MESVEAELRIKREERECILSIIAEDEEQSKRMEKMSRLKRAWQLKMNSKRYQRMVQIMEEMSVWDGGGLDRIQDH